MRPSVIPQLFQQLFLMMFPSGTCHFQFCLVRKITAAWLWKVTGPDPQEFWIRSLQWALGELSRLRRHPPGPYPKQILHHLPHSTPSEASGSPTR